MSFELNAVYIIKLTLSYQKKYFIGIFNEKYSWYFSLKIAFGAIETKIYE